MLKSVAMVFLLLCSSAQAQDSCADIVRSASILTFAEIECKQDFGSSKAAPSLQSCASFMPETEFDALTREADRAFRQTILSRGLAAACADAGSANVR